MATKGNKNKIRTVIILDDEATLSMIRCNCLTFHMKPKMLKKVKVCCYFAWFKKNSDEPKSILQYVEKKKRKIEYVEIGCRETHTKCKRFNNKIYASLTKINIPPT